jgi:hypothetical protein
MAYEEKVSEEQLLQNDSAQRATMRESISVRSSEDTHRFSALPASLRQRTLGLQKQQATLEVQGTSE